MAAGSPTIVGITLLNAIIILVLAGAVGGLVNAFLSTEGFIVSRMQTLDDGSRVWRPGFLGNVFVGSVTAFVLGGLYGPGPLAQIIIGNGGLIPINVGIVAGAVVSGVGGTRLLTQEVDKKLADATNKQMSKVVDNLIRTQRRNP
jgi:hypothetical protein